MSCQFFRGLKDYPSTTQLTTLPRNANARPRPLVRRPTPRSVRTRSKRPQIDLSEITISRYRSANMSIPAFMLCRQKLWAGYPWPDFRRRAVLPHGNPMYRERIADGRQVGPVYSDPTIAIAEIDAWLEFNERSHQTMAQGSASFTAEVCGNGHVTTSAVESSPERTAKFCSICGSATIRACPECNAPIQGQDDRYWEDLPSRYLPDEYSPPNHCHNCGAPFPWTRARLQAAKEHAAEIEGLDEHERQQLPGIIDDLASEGPRTELAADRFERIMQKVGPTVGSVFQRVVVDVMSETAKKLLGGL
jgi:hypothetical protein